MVQIFFKECMERLLILKRLLISALAMVANKSSNGKFTAKIQALYVTLVDKYLDQMLVIFVLNHMVPTIQKFELFNKKCVTIFDKVLMPFRKMFL